jgi:BirA family biotin operon repressor/biotin-[acetyl-CoA-carboxylase] ligase
VDSVRFDGVSAAELAERLSLPRVALHDRVASTMDIAHAASDAGAVAGTLVLADAQDAGRGRGGKRWASLPGRGLWMTLIERPASPRGLDVLSLRLGLHAAEALEGFAEGTVRLKWPNDLFVGKRKLAGILVEARWRDQRVDAVSIGFGLNVVPPDDLSAAGLRAGTNRLEVLDALVPVLRAAAAAEGPFEPEELNRYASRDLAVGQRIVQPTPGVVAGVSLAGELMVDTQEGRVTCRGGSLVFAEES